MGPCWGQLQDELGQAVPLGRDKGPVCFLPPTPQKGQLPQHKGSTVRLGPPASGGRVEGMVTGSRVAVRGGRSACRTLGNTQVPEQIWPPSRVRPAEEWKGLGTTWVLPSVIGRTQLSGEGLALYLGSSWAVARGWAGS